MAYALNIENLSKTFDQEIAVDNVSLTLEEGEIFGLLGPNGAGKSTTINMICGATRIDSGKVSVFGYDNVRDFQTTRRLIGVMHQEIVPEPIFLVGRALQLHSGLFGALDDEKWRNMLIDRLDLRRHLKKRFIALSGGMKRRVMLIKALLHKPRLLILDEPTAGVDVELRQGLWSFVREIRDEGVSILLTTHYLEEAELMCDRIAIMNHGKIAALQRTEDLLNTLGERRLSLTLESLPPELPAVFRSFEPKVDLSERKVNFHVNDGSEIAKIIQFMKEHQLNVQEVETIRPDLEEVFLSITRGQNGS